MASCCILGSLGSRLCGRGMCRELIGKCSQDWHPTGSEEGRTGQRERLGCDASRRSWTVPHVALELGWLFRVVPAAKRGPSLCTPIWRQSLGLRQVVLFSQGQFPHGTQLRAIDFQHYQLLGEARLQPRRGALGDSPQYPPLLSSPHLVAEQELTHRFSVSKPNEVSLVFPAPSRAPLSQRA